MRDGADAHEINACPPCSCPTGRDARSLSGLLGAGRNAAIFHRTGNRHLQGGHRTGHCFALGDRTGHAGNRPTSAAISLIRFAGSASGRRTTPPIEVFDDGRIVMQMGDFEAVYGGGEFQMPSWCVMPEQRRAWPCAPWEAELNLLRTVDDARPTADVGDSGVRLSGRNEWVRYDLLLENYPYNPGLLHYQVVVEAQAQLPSGAVELEWQFVNSSTGEETAANMEFFAERASFAAPMFYAYSETLDATLLYWFDLTRINPFIEATRYGPAGTAGHRGRSFGHTLTTSDLRKLPTRRVADPLRRLPLPNPGPAADEGAMYTNYLLQVSDIYDLIAKPEISLPDWQALAKETLADLDDPATWVELDGKRYWRAYVSDTRQSAEAITQLDVGLACSPLRGALRR